MCKTSSSVSLVITHGARVYFLHGPARSYMVDAWRRIFLRWSSSQQENSKSQPYTTRHVLK